MHFSNGSGIDSVMKNKTTIQYFGAEELIGFGTVPAAKGTTEDSGVNCRASSTFAGGITLDVELVLY